MVLPESQISNTSRNSWPANWRNRTSIVGVINVTPDSFSDGGLFLDPEKALLHAIDLVDKGADVLDIGAQSTRPGAFEVGVDEELKRLIPVVSRIRERLSNVIISIDTYHSIVAKELLSIGADWINDISGGRHDSSILNVVAQSKCPYVITHSRGNSLTMDQLNNYGDVYEDVYQELRSQTNIAFENGVSTEQVIWDPGLGFAKNTEQNLCLLRNLEKFSSHGYPLLVGPSRKRFIGHITHVSNPIERIIGTAAVVSRCVHAKVNFVRVHDVETIFKTILMSEALWN